ncbi:DNA polymerase III subunit alpha, partial [Clavibacter sp. VKM Ac-2873]|uniref:OB-fold nucleic acid binding domain-containing protein n=1 Tax=Clavibacter sp. VKM Ac-2873 TaxID=2783813 RepID=UPI0019E07FBF|nr:DNA polymerase III subunit alpha [Clavibacter sp. VKM Ac-2873]
VQLEDFGGEITCMFMGKAYQEFAPALISDGIVVIRGRVSMRDDGMNIHAFSVMTPEVGQARGSGPLVVSIAEHSATTVTVQSLKEILRRHSGDDEVRLQLIKGETARIFGLPMKVALGADLFGELKTLLGPGCLR